jgi:hypothetical protein
MPPGTGNRYGKADEQGLIILPPRRGTTVIRNLVAAPGEVWQIPAAWHNRWISLCAVGGDAYFQTSPDATMTMALTASVSTPPAIPALTNNSPFPLPAGIILPYYFDATDDLFFGIMGASAAGQFFGTVSSPRADMR